MTFDNKRTTIRVYLRKFIVALFIALLVILFLVSNWFDKPVFGLDRYHLTIMAAAVYVVIIIFNFIQNYTYFYFNDDGDKIIFRYYPIRPFVSKKNVIEIPKISLARYEIKTTMLGFRRILHLYQRIQTKVAKYPPISITSLTKAERELLEKQLSKYIHK